MTETITIEEISPPRAADLLTRNDNNRPISRKQVDKIKRDIVHDRWKLNCDCIGVSSTGRLLNGQHRLMAIVETGATLRSAVIYGLPDTTMAVLDTGRMRSLGNVLKMNGEKQYAKLAALIKFMVLHDTGRKGHHAVSVSEGMDYLAQHPELPDIVRSSDRYYRLLNVSPTAIGAAYLLITRAGWDADTYFNQLVKPVGEPEGSAIYAVLSRISSRQGLDAVTYAIVLLKGFNSWTIGRPMRTIPIGNRYGDSQMPEVITA